MAEVRQLHDGDAALLKRHNLEFGAARAIDAAIMILDWNDDCWGANAHKMRHAALTCVACARDNLHKLEEGD